jgi:hypothetical protein
VNDAVVEVEKATDSIQQVANWPTAFLWAVVAVVVGWVIVTFLKSLDK